MAREVLCMCAAGGTMEAATDGSNGFFRTEDYADDEGILFVDDDPLTRKLAERALGRLDYPFQITATAEEALHAFNERPCSLLITDLHLPGMSGADLLRTVKDQSPMTDAIVLTGFPSLRTAIETFKHGAYDYLLKPIDMGDLHCTVERCLQTQRLRRELTLERQMRRKFEELTSLKEEFLANVSHELRTPLVSIVGYADLLLDASDGHGNWLGRREIERLAHNAHHLSDMINRVLDLLAISAGRLTVWPRDVDLEVLISESGKQLEMVAADKGISIHVDIEPGIGPVNTDRRRVEQVLSMLTDNALKFTDEGEVRLALRKVSDQGTWAEISVFDNGPGIPAETLAVVFDAFRQVDGSITRRHGGLGIGLALSGQIAQVLSGRLSLESTAGCGTVARLRLPMDDTARLARHNVGLGAD